MAKLSQHNLGAVVEIKTNKLLFHRAKYISMKKRTVKSFFSLNDYKTKSFIISDRYFMEISNFLSYSILS